MATVWLTGVFKHGRIREMGGPVHLISLESRLTQIRAAQYITFQHRSVHVL